ncbi:hypothetical protein CEUSTIGMA_g4058.t1 [Chlamydomonas eustigma]|uniref:Probable DNA helicase MCM8 n=1 Tax=Chlamydomonas eustigma TaxID=1157962 RepID=A0A250X149_9CHLO|nr:hypothetical protein CEUSTIGMA_g4058.t1 [Chlamydomonas eustigma]|eukprot:GAX76612.1 hypothetical protein CEUSTIGMA_g4058.t1 [Chlamydomonas eustigma]
MMSGTEIMFKITDGLNKAGVRFWVTTLTGSLLLPDTPLVLVPAVAVRVPPEQYDNIMDTYLSELLGCGCGTGGSIKGTASLTHQLEVNEKYLQAPSSKLDSITNEHASPAMQLDIIPQGVNNDAPDFICPPQGVNTAGPRLFKGREDQQHIQVRCNQTAATNKTLGSARADAPKPIKEVLQSRPYSPTTTTTFKDDPVTVAAEFKQFPPHMKASTHLHPNANQLPPMPFMTAVHCESAGELADLNAHHSSLGPADHLAAAVIGNPSSGQLKDAATKVHDLNSKEVNRTPLVTSINSGHYHIIEGARDHSLLESYGTRKQHYKESVSRNGRKTRIKMSEDVDVNPKHCSRRRLSRSRGRTPSKARSRSLSSERQSLRCRSGKKDDRSLQICTWNEDCEHYMKGGHANVENEEGPSAHQLHATRKRLFIPPDSESPMRKSVKEDGGEVPEKVGDNGMACIGDEVGDDMVAELISHPHNHHVGEGDSPGLTLSATTALHHPPRGPVIGSCMEYPKEARSGVRYLSPADNFELYTQDGRSLGKYYLDGFWKLIESSDVAEGYLVRVEYGHDSYLNVSKRSHGTRSQRELMSGEEDVGPSFKEKHKKLRDIDREDQRDIEKGELGALHKQGQRVPQEEARRNATYLPASEGPISSDSPAVTWFRLRSLKHELKIWYQLGKSEIFRFTFNRKKEALVEFLLAQGLSSSVFDTRSLTDIYEISNAEAVKVLEDLRYVNFKIVKMGGRDQLLFWMVSCLTTNLKEQAWQWLKSKILLVGAAGDELAISLNIPEFAAACKVSEVVDAVNMQPSEAIPCLSISFHEVLTGVHGTKLETSLGYSVTTVPPPHIRPTHVNPEMFIRQLKGSFIGRCVTMRGTVVRMGVTRPLATEMAFMCGKCGSKIISKFPDGKFTPPTRCSEKGCRSKTFGPNRASARCRDWRKIRIQELVGADKQQAGQVPRTLDVEMWDDLVNSCMVGDVVVVTGAVKVLATGDDIGKLGSGKGQKQDLFLLYLEALSIQNPNSSLRAVSGCGQLQRLCTSREGQALHGASSCAELVGAAGMMGPVHGLPPGGFTSRDLEFINKFTQARKCGSSFLKSSYCRIMMEYDGDQLRQLVHSLCPSILGQELVKAGLLLALMGGVRKGGGTANSVPTRGDIHVLVVGDPGLGKSQMLQAAAAVSPRGLYVILQAAAAVSPRGLYVCGKTSSSAGLTVSVVRDAITGEHVFEAGAVVLADGGTCCIDEFDKMTTEHQALLEAMEQQEVSVAKAGLVASLPARTSILAAANPVEGHFNKTKTVAENLKISAAMLSRFDLIFILMDRPDDALDHCVSEHVLALHSGQAGRPEAARQRLLEFRSQSVPLLPGPSGSSQHDPSRLPLSQRLMTRHGDDDPLPPQLLRKYIAYAKQYVHPRLSDEARQVIGSFYLHLRGQTVPGSSTPVTARQLESMVRLSEARARLELREEVTREDAEVQGSTHLVGGHLGGCRDHHHALTLSSVIPTKFGEIVVQYSEVHWLQDVVEIMREALYNRLLDDITCVDFRQQGGGGRPGSKAAEAKRFLTALRRTAERQGGGRNTFSLGELFSLANEINLQVKDVSAFISHLNDGGDLLKAGGGMYKIRGVNPAAATPSPAGFSQQFSGAASGSVRVLPSQFTMPAAVSGHVGFGWDTPMSSPAH